VSLSLVKQVGLFKRKPRRCGVILASVPVQGGWRRGRRQSRPKKPVKEHIEGKQASNKNTGEKFFFGNKRRSEGIHIHRIKRKKNNLHSQKSDGGFRKSAPEGEGRRADKSPQRRMRPTQESVKRKNGPGPSRPEERYLARERGRRGRKKHHC